MSQNTACPVSISLEGRFTLYLSALNHLRCFICLYLPGLYQRAYSNLISHFQVNEWLSKEVDSIGEICTSILTCSGIVTLAESLPC